MNIFYKTRPAHAWMKSYLVGFRRKIKLIDIIEAVDRHRSELKNGYGLNDHDIRNLSSKLKSEWIDEWEQDALEEQDFIRRERQELLNIAEKNYSKNRGAYDDKA